MHLCRIARRFAVLSSDKTEKRAAKAVLDPQTTFRVLNGWVESYMGASLAQAMHSRQAWFESETCPDTVISDVPYLGEICVSVYSTDPWSVAFCASIKALRIQVSKIQWHIFELSRQEITLFFILLSILYIYFYLSFEQ